MPSSLKGRRLGASQSTFNAMKLYYTGETTAGGISSASARVFTRRAVTVSESL